jgi:hypothetical protein
MKYYLAEEIVFDEETLAPLNIVFGFVNIPVQNKEIMLHLMIAGFTEVEAEKEIKKLLKVELTDWIDDFVENMPKKSLKELFAKQDKMAENWKKNERS